MSLVGTFETCRPTLTMSVHQGKTGSAWLIAKATRMTQTSNVPIKETILEHGLVGAPALIE